MIIKLILLQIIAKLIADFLFQPQKWFDLNEKQVLSGIHIYHA